MKKVTVNSWWQRNRPDTDAALVVAVIVLTIVLLALLLLAGIARAQTCTEIDVPPGALTHAVDGDTIAIFSIPQGKMKFRVEGIDTPERSDKVRWAAAKAFTWSWLNQGQFHLRTCWKLTFERYVATVSRNGETLGSALYKAGHAKIP